MVSSVFFLVFTVSVTTSIVGLFLGSGINSKRKNVVASLYEISAGMMTGIVCFEMIPEGIEVANINLTLIGCIIGALFTLLLDIAVNRYKNKKNKLINSSSLIIIISMSVHNIVEGIAIGSALVYSMSLGISILISNALHDIPEAMVVGIGINKERNNIIRKILKAIILGIPTALGAIIGNIVGSVSNTYIALSLSLAGGCMLYIVACDLIPSSKEISKRKIVSLVYIIGILFGLYISTVK
ncbi:MAG: putative divalent heavy-metal cations transporter [Clostridia bacterium]|jgi:ZIP family zinc transporter|nr:putative divalent heavy-metal cations transporter [Clostridia bacterium]